MSDDTSAVEKESDPADDGSADEALEAAEDRREALRQLLSRDSAVDWSGIKADKETERSRRPAAKHVASRPTKRPSRPTERPHSTRRLSGEVEEDRHDLKEALAGAWGDARKQMETARTSRLEHARAVREAQAEVTETPEAAAEPAKPEAAPPPKAATPEIPRAARPAPPKPLPRPAPPPPYLPSSSLAGRLKWVVAVLVVGLIYLGVSGRMAKTEFKQALAEVTAEHDRLLGGIQTEREKAETRANESAAKMEALLADKEELVTSRAEVTKRRRALDEKVERLDHDLELAREGLNNSAKALLEVRAEAERARAAWKTAREALEASLAGARSDLVAERQVSAEAKAKADAREKQLELAIADSEAEVGKTERALKAARSDRDRFEGVANALTAELQVARADTTKARIRAERAERELLQAEATAQSAQTAVRVGLTARQLAPDGSLLPAASPVVQNAGASGTRASVPVSAGARAQLTRAALGEVLVAVRVQLDAAPPFTITLSAGTVSLGEPLANGAELRFWVGAGRAKALLAQDPLDLVVGSEGAGDRLAAVQVQAVELVASPLSKDLRARLDQLGQR